VTDEGMELEIPGQAGDDNWGSEWQLGLGTPKKMKIRRFFYYLTEYE
jgi:hypothetical protein